MKNLDLLPEDIASLRALLTSNGVYHNRIATLKVEPSFAELYLLYPSITFFPSPVQPPESLQDASASNPARELAVPANQQLKDSSSALDSHHCVSSVSCDTFAYCQSFSPQTKNQQHVNVANKLRFCQRDARKAGLFHQICSNRLVLPADWGCPDKIVSKKSTLFNQSLGLRGLRVDHWFAYRNDVELWRSSSVRTREQAVHF